LTTDEDVSSDRLFGMRRCRGWDIIIISSKTRKY
jgi:hypothetical protein